MLPQYRVVKTPIEIESFYGLKNRVYIWKTLAMKKVEKAMAAHSSTLAWKIPWMEEPGRLQSMGSLRVRHE